VENRTCVCCNHMERIEHFQPPYYYERFYQRIWRPAIAFLYIAMNTVDYIIRPAINYYHMSRIDLTEVVLKIKDLDSVIQLKIVEIMSNGGVIPPILSEFVHLSFGAILGVAAYTRYREKEKLMNG